MSLQAPSRPLKVALICHSDLLGGAAVVTWRLMHALRAQGIDARMIVYTKVSLSPWVANPGTRFGRGFRFAWECGAIMLNNGFDRDSLFKVSIADTGLDLSRHPWVRDADIINLNWINQGMLSMRGLRKLASLGKPVVWTMHDMWTLTGVCHHAYECDGYERECGSCPQLNSHRKGDISHRVWARKKALYDRWPMTYVAVSTWLAECARRSSLLRDQDVTVIPNAFPIDEFHVRPVEGFPSFDPITTRRRIIFGAARLDDPIKGLDIAIDALNAIFDNSPSVPETTGIIFFGDLRDKSKLDRLRFPYLYMGRVDDPKLVRQLYASSDVVLSTSLYETLPGTLIEGQAAGCLPVTFGRGGQGDIVTHRVDGYIAEYPDPKDIARGILWALNAKVDRQALHDSVGRRFGAESVAKRYIDLYTRLLEKK